MFFSFSMRQYLKSIFSFHSKKCWFRSSTNIMDESSQQAKVTHDTASFFPAIPTRVD